jgi:hypothetical protein
MVFQRQARGRRPQAQSARSQVQMLKRAMHGHKNNIRHVAPPQVTRRPWYPLVVDYVKPEAGIEVFFTPSEICNILVNQLGLPSQASSIVNIKVSRVDVYSMPTGSSTDRPSVSMDVSSVTPSIGDPATPGTAEVFYGIMKKLSDQGNLSDAAKVSYTWPSHMQDIPLSSQSVFTLVAASGNQANTLTRFHLLWSTSDSATPVA